MVRMSGRSEVVSTQIRSTDRSPGRSARAGFGSHQLRPGLGPGVNAGAASVLLDSVAGGDPESLDGEADHYVFVLSLFGRGQEALQEFKGFNERL